MNQEHLTPDGWKPCTASTKECKYEERRIADVSAFIDSSVEAVQAGKPNAIKNFFGSIKTSTPKSESALKTLVIPKSPPILDKVVQGEDGQYQVVCLDRWDNDRPRTHRFGNLIKDKAIAERLHQADPHKNYQLGWCDRLAAELWTYNKHVAEYYIFNTESDSGIHHFVQLKNGTYADSLGIWTEEPFFSKWKEDRPTLELSTFDKDHTKSRNPFLAISNGELFSTVNELINKHMAGKTL